MPNTLHFLLKRIEEKKQQAIEKRKEHERLHYEGYWRKNAAIYWSGKAEAYKNIIKEVESLY